MIEFIHSGEWARVGHLMVYPRDKDTNRKPTTYSIGRLSGAREYKDLINQTGFANMQAAIDQAVFLTENPEMLDNI